MKIPAERLERWVGKVFQQEGMAAASAELVAKVLVWANLRGMDTHGVVRVPRYVDLIRAGDLNPRPAMTTRTLISTLFAAAILAPAVAVSAGTPVIDYIELLGTNQVLVHFDTEKNREYILQYSASLTATSQWVGVFTVKSVPFANHFIYADNRLAPQRYYRLSVTP